MLLAICITCHFKYRELCKPQELLALSPLWQEEGIRAQSWSKRQRGSVQ